MNDKSNAALANLDLPGGKTFRIDGRDICLTDLWRAAGAVDSKRPSDWLALPQTKALLAEISNAEKSGISLWRADRGVGGGTWADWRVALAYAEYLSPAFHVHVLETYMLHMTGQAPAQGLTRYETALAVFIEHTDRRFELVAAQVEEERKRVEGKADRALTRTDDHERRIGDLEAYRGKQRKGFSPRDKWDALRVIESFFGGVSPVTGRKIVENGLILSDELGPLAQYDHFDNNRANCNRANIWLIDRELNNENTKASRYAECEQDFRRCQQKMSQLPKVQTVFEFKTN